MGCSRADRLNSSGTQQEGWVMMLGEAVPGWPRRRALKGHVCLCTCTQESLLQTGSRMLPHFALGLQMCKHRDSLQAACLQSCSAAIFRPVARGTAQVSRMPLGLYLVLFCWTDLSHLLQATHVPSSAASQSIRTWMMAAHARTAPQTTLGTGATPALPALTCCGLRPIARTQCSWEQHRATSTVLLKPSCTQRAST